MRGWLCHRVAFACHFEANEVGANRKLVADFATAPQDLAADRSRNLDGGLVSHDGSNNVILSDHIANLHVPFDDFGFGDAFADIRQPDRVRSHVASPSFMLP